MVNFDFSEVPGNTIEQQCNFAVQKERESSKNISNNSKSLLSNVLRFLQVQKERVERKEITGATLCYYSH